MWEKKLKTGYCKTLESADAGESDSQYVAGGMEPMLAHKYAEQAKKIVFPAYCQPKLDGIRCIAMLANGVCKLWTRTRKPITGVPHINRAIEAAFPNRNMILDGELYNHEFKTNFEEIVSIVRQVTPKEGHEVVQYHCYDLVADSKSGTKIGSYFAERSIVLAGIVAQCGEPLVYVSTREVADSEELIQLFSDDRNLGYEGTMVRNASSIYETKRSYNLQKIKSFDDAEFEIVGVKAGRGRMAECAIFMCLTKKGGEFDCKMEGSLELLKPILRSPKKYIGKNLTVRYQGMTNSSPPVPRFPVGVALRDFE
jgi:DNA ligase-1